MFHFDHHENRYKDGDRDSGSETSDIVVFGGYYNSPEGMQRFFAIGCRTGFARTLIQGMILLNVKTLMSREARHVSVLSFESNIINSLSEI